VSTLSPMVSCPGMCDSGWPFTFDLREDRRVLLRNSLELIAVRSDAQLQRPSVTG